MRSLNVWRQGAAALVVLAAAGQAISADTVTPILKAPAAAKTTTSTAKPTQKSTTGAATPADKPEAAAAKPADEANTATPEAAKPAKPVGVSEFIIRQANAERARFRMPALRPNYRLGLAARNLAEYMARTGQFSHYAGGSNPSSRAAAQGYGSFMVTENIAMNYGGSSPPNSVAARLMQQWMNSSGHRANLLSGGVNEIGVATARTPDGRIYAVQVFGRAPYRAVRPASQSSSAGHTSVTK